jgi:hypothetical protein
MPFIRRKRTAEAESTFSKVDVEHEFYVKAREVQKGDVVLKPDEIQDEILRDLAKTHPKEFAKAALDRGLLDVDDDEDEDELPFSGGDDDDDEDEQFSPVQEAFMLLNAEKAIEAIKAAAADPELLAQYAEAEAAKEQPRKTVLAALQAALDEK